MLMRAMGLCCVADGMAVSLSSDLYSTIPPEDGGPDNGGHVFPIKLLQGVSAGLLMPVAPLPARSAHHPSIYPCDK